MKKLIIVIVLIAALGAGFYWRDSIRGVLGGAATPAAPQTGSGATPEAIAEIAQYEYSKGYRNEAYGFTFRYPADFTVTSMPIDGGDVVLVQNTKKNIGVQILITGTEEGVSEVTEADIKASLPELLVQDSQPLLLGEDGSSGKGLAFVSDNESFGGKSREVWFVYGGYLYQISTYAELDEFLKGLFATWQFE